MDKYILQLKVKKWAEACQFLKSEDVKNAMDPEEWSAIEILSKKWQATSYSQLMVDECNEMIEVLIACDKLHSNNRNIITWSKEFRGIARMMYTTDAETFNQFKSALKELYGTHIPEKKKVPEKKEPKKEEPKWTIRNDEVIITAVSFLDMCEGKVYSDMGFKVYNDAKYITPQLTIRTNKRGNVVIKTVAIYPSGSKADYDTEITLNGSGTYKLDGWGNSKGTSFMNEIGVVSFEFFIGGKSLYKSSLQISPSPRTNDAMTVVKMDFAEKDINGKIITPYGRRLYETVKYIAPRITLKTNRFGNVTFKVKVNFAEYHDEYSVNITLNGSGDYELLSWGNQSGTVYLGCKEVEFIVFEGDKMLYIGTLMLAESPHAHEPIRIDKAEFADVTYDGDIIHNYGTALYDNMQYFKPKLHVTTTRIGMTRFTIRLISPSGKTEEYQSSVKIIGSGAYVLGGWGSKNGNTYTAGRWVVEFIADGRSLGRYSFIVNSTSSNNQYKTSTIKQFKTPTNNQIYNRDNKTTVIKKKKKTRWPIFVAIIIAFIWFGDPVINMMSGLFSSAEKMYVISDEAWVPVYISGGEASGDESLKFGDEVEIIDNQNAPDGMTEIKNANLNYVDNKGYINKYDYTTEENFNKLVSILDSEEKRRMASSSLSRQALISLVNSGAYSTFELVDGELISLPNGYDTYDDFVFIYNDNGIYELRVYGFDASGNPVWLDTKHLPKRLTIGSVTYKDGTYYYSFYNSQGKKLYL